MTLVRPLPRPARRRFPWAVLMGVAIIAAVIGYLAFSEVGKALVYYLTPTELLAKGEAAFGETVRLGGLVKPGSKHGPDTNLWFTLTDGTTDIQVHTSVAPPALLKEGAGAVVEGRLGVNHGFEATQVVVKHDENYVAPTNGAVPSHVAQPGS
ncbi:MAG: cytochrome c maturation protein CcmE [Chloroflexi bacterium]|nr:MAG: cytochrome c maturation protein CcmE [Chloroflexota bacterium]